MSIWERLPTVARAILSGLLVLAIGQLPWLTLLLTNLQVSPGVPWAAPAMAAYLWLFWQYLKGRGWPQSTSQARRESLRAAPLSPKVWRRALLAGGAAAVSLRALHDMCRRLSTRPEADLISPDKLNVYPPWTVLCLLLMMAAVAGIVEEAAFRGYMQAPLERKYGWRPAIVTVAAVFAVAHFRFGAPDPIAWLIFLPVYLGSAVAFGALASFTGSIVPGIVLHTLLDAVGLLQYWLLGIPRSVWEVGTDRGFWIRLVIALAAGAVAIPAYRRLWRCSTDTRGARGAVARGTEGANG